MEDQLTPSVDDVSITEGPGVTRKSACCLADVDERLTVYEQTETGEVAGIHFVCQQCDQECAAYADPRLIALEEANRA